MSIQTPLTKNAITPENLVILKEAKGGTWYDGWRPYCLQCSTMARMEQTDTGFKCVVCANTIGWDLKPL